MMNHHCRLILRCLTLGAIVIGAFSSTGMAQTYRWRRDPSIVNLNGDSLKARRNEVRFKDWLKDFSVSDTRFSIHFRDQDRDYVAWDVTMTASFTAPPEVIESGQTVKLKASISGGGQVTEGRPGITFHYNSRGVSLRGERTLSGGFEGSSFNGGSIEPYFEPPQATQYGEFRIYASLWNEPPCNVMWIYRAEPVPTVEESDADADDGQKGELLGHIVKMHGDVRIVRGGQHIEAWQGMPVFAGDRIITGENGRARLSAFLVDAGDAWQTTVNRITSGPRRSLYEEELGRNWQSRIPYPAPTHENISDFVRSLPKGMMVNVQDEYLKTVHTWGNNVDIGDNSDVQAGQITGGLMAYLRNGIVRVFRGAAPDLSRYADRKSAQVCIPLPSGTPQRQATGRWSGLSPQEREMYTEAADRHRQLYGEASSLATVFFGKPGFVLRPKGTDFAVEYTPSAGRMVLGVQEGQVECLDFQSGQAATLAAGEAVQLGTGHQGNIVSMTSGDWEKVISMTAQPERAENTGDTTGADIPRLNGRVTGVRMFESGPNLTPYEQRQYRETFTTSQVRYLCWELALAFPKPSSRIDFKIEARFFGSDGQMLFNQQHDAHVLPDWTTSVHSRGWGDSQPGYWKPGKYRVDIYVEGQSVGSTSFEVTAGTERPNADREISTSNGTIPVIQAKVNALKFFESAFNTPPANEWVLADRFPKSTTRYIYWALFFEYPAQGRRVEFTIDAVWYRPDGRVLARQSTPTYVEPQWTGSNCSNGWGSMIPGTFAPGTYRVELSANGNPVASGTFEIVD